jgi:DNA-binding HxlR family transcriptional regulator
MLTPSQNRKSSPVPLDDCGLVAAAKLLGDRWKILILREIIYQVSRFDDIRDEISIPRSVLSNRLAELVNEGILKRSEYREEGQRMRFEYLLTSKGAELLLPLAALWQWSEKHIEGKSSGLVLKQKSTGSSLVVGLVPTGSNVTMDDVTYEVKKPDTEC